VTKQDVQRFADAGPVAVPAAAGAAAAPRPVPIASGPDDERVPLRGLRKRISEAMARSVRTAAHFSYVDECDVTELVALRTLYDRDHLDQVLATFGLILFFNELIAIVWGRAALYTSVPRWLGGHVELLPGVRYPFYRVVIIVVGVAVAALLWGLVTRTHLGMLIRAGASNRTMVAALGVNIRLLYTVVFGFGAALAGLAGLMAGPIYAVQPGMGEQILIQVFVVIVIGGIGSIRGALVGAVVVGMVDTLGRAFLKPLLATVLSPSAADSAGPALASMMIYLLMAAVLAVRPQGLFPVHGR